MTDQERAVLQKLVDDMYERFLEVVAEGRPGLSKDQLREVADGRVVSGKEAKALDLVDAVGYMSDAIEEARKRAGIESPTIVRYTRAARSGANVYSLGDLDRLSDGAARSGEGIHLSLDAQLDATPRLYYLWRPGF
jgi:protease-4